MYQIYRIICVLIMKMEETHKQFRSSEEWRSAVRSEAAVCSLQDAETGPLISYS